MTVKINTTTSGLIESVDTSGVLEFQIGGVSALVVNTDQNANFTGTTAITVPNGTTAQRPTPINGMMRYNTSLSIFEVYANNSWSAANVTPAPVNTVAPVISGSAVVGQNLTSTTGTWSGSPSAYYYQWRANASPISGATSNVLALTLFENGASITCNVTAYNVAGNSTPATSNTLGPVILGTTVNYLMVAGGGGGGGQYYSGGGGAGGLQTGTTILQPANTYSITIGAGGAGGVGVSVQGVNGSNTTFSAVSNASVGGGGGGAWNSNPTYNGLTGGSGGGGANSGSGASGVSGQGNAGGNGGSTSGGGGGGASAVGTAGSGTNGGAGGSGTSSSISGTATFYAGGGGGSGGNNGGADGSSGTGGNGGGGAGGAGNSGSGTPGYPGTANTGGGGGGDFAANAGGGRGGSGIVIISYPGAQAFGGGVISTAGGNTIHTFYTSGSLVPLTALNSSYLIVAGGGGGGSQEGGGGGAGGLLSGSNVTIDSSSTYAIVVGAGGAGASFNDTNKGVSGSNSSWSVVSTTAVGGGGGGTGTASGNVGANGGSGGGGSAGGGSGGYTGGTGVSGQGFAGGTATTPGGSYAGAGGGGASQAGFNGTASLCGNGGNGTSSSISGAATYYAGGGGGGGVNGYGATAGTGGLGGGGNGSITTTGSAATANTGGGGGGGGNNSGNYGGGAGGSGVVIVSYPGSTPQMAGGNVTVVSNTVVHTFTSSGFLTPFVLVNNSLRFRSSASAKLSRTPSVASNRQTFTWSGWIKRGTLGAFQQLFGAVGSTYDALWFNSSDTIQLVIDSGNAYGMTWTPVYRDPAAWYHIMLAVDTTQSNSANRIKLYVNGVQVTALSTNIPPPQNYSFINIDTVTGHYIGGNNTSAYYDGYQANVQFIDGQALTPNSFGTFNQYGVWQPVAYAGSYGTNGFFLPFTNTANTTALGYDFSPQGNNYTPTNISLTAGYQYDSMVDVPTLTSANVANYCVLNPLNKTSNMTLNYANMYISGVGSGSSSGVTTTIRPSSGGKYYFEFVPEQTADGNHVMYLGIAPAGFTPTTSDARSSMYAYFQNSGVSSGSVMAVTIDRVNNELKSYLNNTLQATASIPSTIDVDIYIGTYQVTGYINFGQQPFYYTPPSGFLPLNTYNL